MLECFNPCFRGSRPRTDDKKDGEPSSDKFQSLFSWKSPSDFSHSLHSLHVDGVSILVFVEVALGPYINLPAADSSIMFQSLFSWKSPSDWFPDSIASARLPCFNPCFRGSRPRTLSFLSVCMVAMLFQSLFSWKSPSDFKTEQVASVHVLVSILVFVEVALGLLYPGRSYISIILFQSLFSWKSPSDFRC